MKKLLVLASFLAVLSCSKKNPLDPVQSCDKELGRYTTAVEDWSKDPNNKTKCEAVKKSLEDILKSCSVYTAAQRKIYEEQLKDFTCD